MTLNKPYNKFFTKAWLIPAFILYCLSCGNTSQKPLAKATLKDSIPADSIPKADTLSLIAVGDIMFGSNFPDASHLPPNDGKDLLTDLTSVLSDADITFGNSEGVFMDAGGESKGVGPNVYSFREPKKYAQFFVDNGFDLISVANNHVADFGKVGMNSTVSTLEELNLKFAGVENHPTTIFTIKNKKIGMAAFAPHTGCIQMNDHAAAIASVQKLKKECDIVVVSFHGGAEGKNAQHVTRKTEMFFNQNRGNVYEFAHKMIDAGADVVIGHGPHVARAMELYNNKFIAYSLGNFCTYGQFNLKGPNGFAPLLKIWMDEKGDFAKGTITSVKQEGEGGPRLDAGHNSYNMIKELTAVDFPESKLIFADSVNITKK
jgi:hypothetical protein